jgi:hypothetical protein
MLPLAQNIDDRTWQKLTFHQFIPCTTAHKLAALGGAEAKKVMLKLHNMKIRIAATFRLKIKRKITSRERNHWNGGGEALNRVCAH